MRKTIYFIISVIMTAAICMVSCADRIDSNLNQTGLIDQNGNVLTNTLVKTNSLRFTGDIPAWATNMNVDYIITTNLDYSEIRYSDDILAPDLSDKPTDYYKIYVPYAGKGDDYYTVSYKDTNKLKQLWLDQINRRGMDDGKVFAIRNKSNNRDLNNFQNLHKNGNYQARDYYYFNDNGDIVWKEDGRIIKKFVGAIITGHRDVNKYFGDWNGMWNEGPYHGYAIERYEWKQRGVLTVGGVYANTLSIFQARKYYFKAKTGGEEDFKSGDDPFKDGVYDFIAYRCRIETFNNGIYREAKLFERQFVFPNFVEVFVVDPEDNLGYKDAAGVYSFYAYYGVYDLYGPYEGNPGFTRENIPYMTNQNIYLGQRPEYTTTLLTHSAAFTDGHRNPNWHYLFMPGQKN